MKHNNNVHYFLRFMNNVLTFMLGILAVVLAIIQSAKLLSEEMDLAQYLMLTLFGVVFIIGCSMLKATFSKKK